MYLKFKELLEADVAGAVCSLRFAWHAPRDMRVSGEELAYGVMGGMIEITESLGGGSLHSLHIEVADEGNVLFAIARLDNQVVAELDLNQSLPPGAEHICHLQVDCEHGRLTNRPVVGHQSCEGSMLVKDGSREMISFQRMPHGDPSQVDARIRNQIENALKGQR